MFSAELPANHGTVSRWRVCGTQKLTRLGRLRIRLQLKPGSGSRGTLCLANAQLKMTADCCDCLRVAKIRSVFKMPKVSAESFELVHLVFEFHVVNQRVP